MSDRAQGSDWWLASDGKWYPPRPPQPPHAIASPSATAAPASPGVPYGLTLATALNFALVALLCLITGVLRFDEASKFADWRETGLGDSSTSRALDSAESASVLAYSFAMWAGLAAFVLTVIWSYKASVATRRFGATGLSWSPGWAVGAWFIPFGNAVIPKLLLHEVERVSSPESGGFPVGDRWRTAKVRIDGWIWWLCLLAGSGMVFVGLVMADQGYPTSVSFDAGSYRRGLQTFGIGFFLLAVSATAGALTIWRLGRHLGRPLTPITTDGDATVVSRTLERSG